MSISSYGSVIKFFKAKYKTKPLTILFERLILISNNLSFTILMF